jgi:hypothetical protein
MTPSAGTDTPEPGPDGIMVVSGADRARSVGDAGARQRACAAQRGSL